mmetsp:Transcript_11493/g.20887  ORF Transcript_11493/g.20887 Transcript_11493/m.20887 type:complete len:170 (+) Transcript_11493:930-1439(+)|eukprot:CAMPEP_0202496854 /NCGR_PEP_ID=MMETSP1361-20130828/21159_1 /ASSEMBLY_ACC=CAM_ASM_000849 /TAXON_ID=210615 /ORGANISM="Staurosira complex sp., Strain CCMP2646" /LENGTH=169 /DNA_ID=CAMNT_0049128289 /DNA_START=797 /DNA_END=1306 /DNA_ORIENTATION=+
MANHKKEEAEQKLFIEMYNYQQKAVEVPEAMHQSNTPLDKMKKNDLSHLVCFGSHLFDANLAFSSILNKKIGEIQDYYTENLQNLVEDESLRILEKPPDSIPLPDVPSLEEILLEVERKAGMQTALSLVASAKPGDITFLEAISNSAREKLRQFEGAEEAKEEEKREED